MKRTLEAVVVVGLAVAIAAAVVLGARWWYAERVPTEVHVLVPEGRRVWLRAGGIQAVGSQGHLVLTLPKGRHEVELLEDERTLRRIELQAPTKTHRLLLPVGRQCFGLYPRESLQPLQMLESEDPIDLAADLVFSDFERPGLDHERALIQPAYDTEKHTWLLVKAVRCGAPGRGSGKGSQ